MSLSSAVIRALMEAGATREQLAAAVIADIAEREARASRQIPWIRLREMAFERDGEVCGWCGCTDGPFEVDHIIPRIDGGENVLENVIVSCRACNRAKKSRNEEEWSELRDRRAKDRERQRRKRARDTAVTKRDSHVTIAVTRDPAPNERDILTPTREEKPPPKGGVKKADRGFRLPPDWEPEPLIGKAATMIACWQAGELERELAKFKNYWLSKGANAARTDWQRTWVNWLISADERKPRNERPGEDPTTAAVRRIIGGSISAHA